jgi:hypothetical protein
VLSFLLPHLRLRSMPTPQQIGVAVVNVDEARKAAQPACLPRPRGWTRHRAAQRLLCSGCRRSGMRRHSGSTEQAWRVVDARNAPLGTGSAATAPMLRDRLAAFGSDKVRLVVDATGAGDAWLDHMVAVGVVPTPAAVVVGSPVSRNVGRSAGLARSISPE